MEETGGEPPSKRSATRSRRTSSSAAPRVAAAQQCGLGLREQAASSEWPEMLREGGLGALDRRHDGKYVARHRVGGELVVDTKRQGSHAITSLAGATHLAAVDAERREVAAGEELRAAPLV